MATTAARRTERRQTGEVVLTPSEAAFVADVSRKTVDQAIDRGEVLPLPARKPGDPPRALGVNAVVYLRLRDEAGDLLSAKAKKQLYRTLSVERERIPDVVEIGAVSVRAAGAAEKVRARLAQIRNVRRFVETDPDVRGGEPVVRGTRVPVYLVADMVRAGVPRDEIVAGYPSLSDQALEAAVLYARLHPRRGRPPAAPWRQGTPRRVFTAEELDAAG
jgi:uncharacterized protein (DUF433 family)